LAIDVTVLDKGRSIEDAAKLLLNLYGLARELPVGEFQTQALLLLKRHLHFCSAIWGEGKLSSLWLAPHKLHTHYVDPDALARWSELIRVDKVIPIMLDNLGTTIPFHAPTLFSDPRDLAMRDYAKQYGRQSYIVTNIPARLARELHWISLYRPDPDALFTEHERSACERLMPHFYQALQINRTVQGLGMLSEGLDAQSRLALIDQSGFVYFAQPGFLELLHSEWSELDEFFVPDPLMAALRAGDGKPFIGRRIRCDSQSAGELIVLYAKRSSALDCLSPRQHEIARLYAVGHSYKEIARRLRLSPATVRNHLAAIFRTLAISTKGELIALAQ
jgi:DNA-binding CsgD family transcriptional regulator